MASSMTYHAQVRCGPRSIREQDRDLVVKHGTQRNCYVDVTEYNFTSKDFNDRVAEIKREIDKLHKLQGTVIRVSDDGDIVTVFRQPAKKPSKKNRRR